jgi:hypothetical protein
MGLRGLPGKGLYRRFGGRFRLAETRRAANSLRTPRSDFSCDTVLINNRHDFLLKNNGTV